MSHDRALAELRRVVSEQAEQIAGLVDQVQLLTDGATVELEGGHAAPLDPLAT